MTAPEAILMGEVAAAAERHHGDFVAGWREVLHRPRRAVLQAAESNADARARSFREVGLSSAQAGLRRLSEAGSSINSVKPTRGGAPTGPDPARKPGESQEAFRVRLRRQVLDLGKRANTAPSLPSDSSASYSEVRAALLNDPDAIAREVGRSAARSVPAPSTDVLTQKAHNKLMTARKQSTEPRSAGFSENFKQALADLS